MESRDEFFRREVEYLGNFGVKLLRQCLQEEPVEKIFTAVTSRLHLLLVALVDPSQLNAQGYYRNQITSQAKKLGMEKVKSLITSLAQIDMQTKSGQTLAPLENHLITFLLDFAPN